MLYLPCNVCHCQTYPNCQLPNQIKCEKCEKRHPSQFKFIALEIDDNIRLSWFQTYSEYIGYNFFATKNKPVVKDDFLILNNCRVVKLLSKDLYLGELIHETKINFLQQTLVVDNARFLNYNVQCELFDYQKLTKINISNDHNTFIEFAYDNWHRSYSDIVIAWDRGIASAMVNGKVYYIQKNLETLCYQNKMLYQIKNPLLKKFAIDSIVEQCFNEPENIEGDLIHLRQIIPKKKDNYVELMLRKMLSQSVNLYCEKIGRQKSSIKMIGHELKPKIIPQPTLFTLSYDYNKPFYIDTLYKCLRGVDEIIPEDDKLNLQQKTILHQLRDKLCHQSISILQFLCGNDAIESGKEMKGNQLMAHLKLQLKDITKEKLLTTKQVSYPLFNRISGDALLLNNNLTFLQNAKIKPHSNSNKNQFGYLDELKYKDKIFSKNEIIDINSVYFEWEKNLVHLLNQKMKLAYIIKDFCAKQIESISDIHDQSILQYEKIVDKNGNLNLDGKYTLLVDSGWLIKNQIEPNYVETKFKTGQVKAEIERYNNDIIRKIQLYYKLPIQQMSIEYLDPLMSY